MQHTIIRSLEGNPVNIPFFQILSAALEAVNPQKIIMDAVYLNNGNLNIGGNIYKLDNYQNIFVIGIGKASYLMSLALSDIVKNYRHRGMILTKYGHIGKQEIPPNFELFEAGHPIPDKNGVAATQFLLSLLQTTVKEDLVIFLISGGGSALLTSPADNLSLDDIKLVTRLLVNCGSSIDEINCVRKHIEKVKGGRLAKAANADQMVSLILSDVIGDQISVIASGPTIGDPTSFQDALEILHKYNLLDSIPPAVIAYLHKGVNGDVEDTPKPFDPLFSKVDHFIIGSNIFAANGALAAAQKSGFNSTIITSSLIGEAKQAGLLICSLAKQVHETGLPVKRPACLILGGETTVTLSGCGLGGRNQEVALAAVECISKIPKVVLATFATDGGDGPTDAAGALVTNSTFQRALSHGMDPNAYLSNHDSYHFFNTLGDLIKTGPTGTNVNDLSFLFLL